MEEKKFIIERIEKWTKLFVGIHVKYGWDATAGFHVIEVDPECIRRGNDCYREEELNLWTEFMELFPESDLLISEPDYEGNDISELYYESVQAKPMVRQWRENFTSSSFIVNNTKVTLLYDYHQNEYLLAA